MFTRHFGRIVREKRERLKMTIAQTAELAELSEVGLAAIELGDSNPKLSSITSLAAVLDIDLGELNACKPEKISEDILTLIK